VEFVSAILLAAGESTRMGRQKALLAWEGTTLIEYQLAQLAVVDEIREIIVVTGHEPDGVTEIASEAVRTRVVHNGDYRTGKVGSILAGLAAVSKDCTAILLLAVDQPRPSSLIRRVVDAHIANDAFITVPASDGHRGHPIIFTSTLRADLAAIDEETLGVRALLDRHAASVSIVEVSDTAVLLDVNSPADLPAL
jgi:molybdenum cofactor cytidylyltransferase